MRKKLVTLIALFLAGAIAYGGSGINLYSYCCDDCRAEGISAVAEHKCCEIHEHEHDHSCTDDTYFSAEDFHACSIERVEANWSNYASKKIAVQPVFTYIHSFVFLPDSKAPELLPQQLRYSDTQKPPDLSEEIYFDLLNTLII